ncbi:ABC transporter permease [Gordonia sp. CPCC 205333]|uniref:ABC transporter permease n=1 Tax=Gordonia sp. CPCC 205333 TaxID=3140790 RepID=UPI003AF3AEDE
MMSTAQPTKRNPEPTIDEQGNTVLDWLRIIGVIVGLELRQRLRTTRWRITLCVLFAFVSLGVLGSLYLAVNAFDATYREWTVNFYAILISILMFVGIILAPTLAATSINGDRKDATLAVVQVTSITNWQLALGKLFANWLASLVVVLIASPYLIWAITTSPYGVGPAILGVAILALLFLCYGGIGLGLSSLTSRPAGSAVLTQATVIFLILGLPALFGLLYESTAERHDVVRQEYSYPSGYDDAGVCTDKVESVKFNHTERIWWLLLPNPFTITADALAPHDGTRAADPDNWDTNGRSVAVDMSRLVSGARTPPYIADLRCSDTQSVRYSRGGRSDTDSYWARERRHENSRVGDSWYLGLLVNLAIGAAGLLIAARRLRVPATKLSRGVRIA